MSKQLLEAIARAGSIALVCHISPDMDTLGSAVGLRFVLEKLGKEVAVYAQDDVPQRFLFIEGMKDVRKPEEKGYDLCIAIDVSDEARMGEAKCVYDAAKETAVVDHHPTTVPYAKTSVICPKAAATAQMLVELCGEYGWEMDAKAATCFWAGISTDSGNFSFDSVTGDTFRAAAKCVDRGAQPGMLTERIYRTSTEGHVRMLGRVLNGLELYADGKVCIVSHSMKDLEECNAGQEDATGIINQALEIESVQAVAHVSERGEIVKCSLRGKAPLDVAAVAVQFGGGGHVRAAGCSFEGKTLEEVCAIMREALTAIVR